MGKLQEYYRLFDMFKGKLNNEQKKILEGLEDQLIAEEILPAISESVAPVLSTLRRPLTLVVEYDPEGGIVVKSTRGEVVVKENTTKEYQIPSTNKTVKVVETDSTSDSEPDTQADSPQVADDANDDIKDPIKRSPATGLCVWTSDTDFIQEKTAALTMAKAIIAAGVDNVATLNIPHDGDFLVSKTKHPKYPREQQPLPNGYLLNTHSSTSTKKRQLDRIIDALHLNWRVEIVK